jgi:hypothetical protein
MALLDAVLDVVQHEYAKSEPVWKISRILSSDTTFLEMECSEPSEFDPFGWRKEMFDKYKKGKVEAEVRECAYGRVVALGEKHMIQDIPWGLWGRILRTYWQGKKAKIFFLANPYLRTMGTQAHSVNPYPSKKYKPLGPENINGGYTYSCNIETIVIYRAEDATRVLLHELQHASCLDHMEHSTDLVEAETEAWAELLYAGLLSQGKRQLFYELVKKQADWMQAQNAVVKRHIHHERQFPWRYTIGKEEVWRRWALLKEQSRTSRSLNIHSLRLTPPPTAALKRTFGVDSNIL